MNDLSDNNQQPIAQFWERITRVNHSRLDAATHNNARLLASLLAAILIAGVPALLATGYYIGVTLDNLFSWAALGVLFLFYQLNRVGRFQLAAVGVILFITAVTIILGVIVGDSPILFTYILLPLFMSFIFMETRRAIFASIGIVGLTAVAMTAFNSPPLFFDRLNIVIFVALIALLFAVFVNHARRVEAMRQARLEQLRGRSEELEALNREIEQFTYVAAHDLKSPLRGVANLAQWIEEEMSDALTPDTQRYFQLLHGRVVRMETIIDGLRQYAQVGKGEAYKEMVNLPQLVEELFAKSAPPAQFKISIQSELPDFIAEKSHLEQIFFQLLDNAVRHHDREDGRITVTAQEASDYYQFAVSDDGPGIDPRYHDKAFAIFQTLQPRDIREGAGVGLPLIKKLIEARGGSIRLRSETGQGTTISFTWPKQFIDSDKEAF
jgi:signal transduction histidine kinase